MREHRPIQESVVTRALVCLVFALLVEVVLHGAHFKVDYERVGTLLALALGFLLAILLEQLILPLKFWTLRRDLSGAHEASTRHPALAKAFQEFFNSVERRAAELRNYRYTAKEGVIPDISLDTINRVTESAFATFVADAREHIYEDARGREYLESWNRKAGELISRGLSKPCRIFLVDELEDVDERTLDLIKGHLTNHIDVQVLRRRDAEDLRAGCELDFGLFDNDCLMTVKPLSVGTSELSVYFAPHHHLNAGEIRRYNDFKGRLLDSDKRISGETFIRDFTKPMNAEFWDQRMGDARDTRLEPPHGLSNADATTMVESLVEHAGRSEDLHVGVLGFTPRLIEACAAHPSITQITLIDQSRLNMPLPKTPKLVLPRVPLNWLDLAKKHSFDAIVGDEALNNLLLRQYPAFFRSTRSALKPEGTLVLRTMGRFEEPEDHLNVAQLKLLEWIKTAPADMSPVERGRRIIEFLHSADIAFDEKRSLIEAKRYNALLYGWVRQREITLKQAHPFFFPDREKYEIQLSSPTRRQLRDLSDEHFTRMPFLAVDSSYCGSDGSLSNFYRITPFTSKER